MKSFTPLSVTLREICEWASTWNTFSQWRQHHRARPSKDFFSLLPFRTFLFVLFLVTPSSFILSPPKLTFPGTPLAHHLLLNSSQVEIPFRSFFSYFVTTKKKKTRDGAQEGKGFFLTLFDEDHDTVSQKTKKKSKEGKVRRNCLIPSRGEVTLIPF